MKAKMLLILFTIALITKSALACPPILDVVIESSSSVTRGETVSLTATAEEVGQYYKEFTWHSCYNIGGHEITVDYIDPDGHISEYPQAMSTWGGTLVTFTVIDVTVCDYSWGQEATDVWSIEVYDRDWGISKIRYINRSWAPKGHTPPDSGYYCGRAPRDYVIGSVNSSVISGGPNDGIKYVVSINGTYYWLEGKVNIDISNHSSEFAQNQDGDYDETYNPNGEISIDNLDTHTTRHEYNSTNRFLSHYGQFLYYGSIYDALETAECRMAVHINGLWYGDDGSIINYFTTYVKDWMKWAGEEMRKRVVDDTDPEGKAIPYPIDYDEHYKFLGFIDWPQDGWQ